tara:strand:- start:175292 stop:175576 length:285 start_codon:yes stop_codon:yes gene_type:complete
MKQEYKEIPTAKELTEMNARIETLKEKANQSREDAKDGFDTQVRAVEDQYKLLLAKMDKVSRQADAVTDDIKDGVSQAWMSLKSSFEDASKRMH